MMPVRWLTNRSRTQCLAWKYPANDNSGCYASPEFLGKVLVGKALTTPRFKRKCEISKGFQFQNILEGRICARVNPVRCDHSSTRSANGGTGRRKGRYPTEGTGRRRLPALRIQNQRGQRNQFQPRRFFFCRLFPHLPEMRQCIQLHTLLNLTFDRKKHDKGNGKGGL